MKKKVYIYTYICLYLSRYIHTHLCVYFLIILPSTHLFLYLMVETLLRHLVYLVVCSSFKTPGWDFHVQVHVLLQARRVGSQQLRWGTPKHHFGRIFSLGPFSFSWEKSFFVFCLGVSFVSGFGLLCYCPGRLVCGSLCIVSKGFG